MDRVDRLSSLSIRELKMLPQAPATFEKPKLKSYNSSIDNERIGTEKTIQLEEIDSIDS
jgi:hypothetical protein